MYNLPDRNLTGTVQIKKQSSGQAGSYITVPNANSSSYSARSYGRYRTTSDYVRTYTSYSGHDMVCTFEIPLQGGGVIAKVVGEVQTISYSIHNEKMPVRVLGDMNVKGFVFGSRTIAGSIVFTVFDRHWAQDLIDQYKQTIKSSGHVLSDEMPGINVTISMANEYGDKSRLAIYHVTFVNEGQVMSINDVYTENTYQFFATDIDYLTTNTDRNSSGNEPSDKELSDAVSENIGRINDTGAGMLKKALTYTPIGAPIDAIYDAVTGNNSFSADSQPSPLSLVKNAFQNTDSDASSYNDVDSKTHSLDDSYKKVKDEISYIGKSGGITNAIARHAMDKLQKQYYESKDNINQNFTDKQLAGEQN